MARPPAPLARPGHAQTYTPYVHIAWGREWGPLPPVLHSLHAPWPSPACTPGVTACPGVTLTTAISPAQDRRQEKGVLGFSGPQCVPRTRCPAEPSRKQGGAGQAPATSGTARVLPVFPPCRLLAFLCVSLNQFCFCLLCNVLLSAAASTLRPAKAHNPRLPASRRQPPSREPCSVLTAQTLGRAVVGLSRIPVYKGQAGSSSQLQPSGSRRSSDELAFRARVPTEALEATCCRPAQPCLCLLGPRPAPGVGSRVRGSGRALHTAPAGADLRLPGIEGQGRPIRESLGGGV